ncbi:MAG: ATP synthase delta/epsilon chain alpha-helix domain-containing protein [Pauljensenia sp.]
MAEASTFYLEIITPERQFYIGPAEGPGLSRRGRRDGSVPRPRAGGHCRGAEELRYKVDGKWEPAAVGAGFVEIKPDYVILLVGFAEHPEEIDRKRAEAARERAEERLRQKQSIHEYYHSKAALARAMARLKTRRE